MPSTRAGYDLAIIGSGSTAFSAAHTAHAKGHKVIMVERAVIGGTCVNNGCVPSKTLLAAAAAQHQPVRGDRFPGVDTTAGRIDFGTVIDGKRALISRARKATYEDVVADEHSWDMVYGTASFALDGDEPVLDVAVDGGGRQTIAAAHYLVATGAKPWVPRIPGLDEAGYLTSTTAMELSDLPATLVVAGGNAVGLEQAQLFARLGADVTVLETLDRIAPFEEPESSAALTRYLEDDGITVRACTTLTDVRRDETGYRLAVTKHGEVTELRADALLMATGRRPATAGLNLDAVGVKTDGRGAVLVDEHLHTSNPRIWAAGDVTPVPQFVYVATAHGKLVAQNALDGAGRALGYTALPRVTFTDPGLAAVGLTSSQALDAGHRIETRTRPIGQTPWGVVNRETRGLVRMISDADTGTILGVHILGAEAGEVVTAAAYALSAGFTVERLAQTWTPAFTMSEALLLTAQMSADAPA